MPSLGQKKNMESKALPQLSNEMQLSLMNKVKNGELSIEDALVQAKRATQQQLNNQVEEQIQPTQHNFSVRKHSHYRWQKRILQIDFTTKIVCSIEKGIVKRQLSFSRVKSCDDGVGMRFSILFQDHHDYELEAMSVEEKYKIVQLVNQIIYQNIYSPSAEDSTVIRQQLPEPSCVREAVLLVHRGGLASFKWVKYEVQLHPSQLVLVPLVCEGPSDSEMSPTVNATRVIHLSDGDTRVNTQHSPDTFTLASHKNQYHFRVPDQARGSEAVLKERDAWAQAIEKVCAGWRRKSEHIYASPRALLRQASEEDGESAPSARRPAGHDGTLLMADETHAYPPVDYANDGLVGERSSSGDNGLSCPPAREVKPVPRRRNRPAGGATGSDSNSAPVAPTPSPTTGGLLPANPNMRPSSPTLTTVRPAPPPPSTVTPAPLPKAGAASHGSFIPVAPPLPCMMPVKAPVLVHTKAFHWDQVTSDKIEKSFWNHGSGKKIEIDMPRLKEQFAAQDLGAFSGADSSKAVNVLLDQKIAHNFNIFLKSFPVQPAELKDKLYILNEDHGGLSEEQITALRRFIPTTDDVEKYKSYKGPISELHIVDQYMMEMCNIPYLSSRLDLLLTLNELPISMRDLEPLIIQKISMCTQLYNSGLFVSVLEYLLAIGNYLNKNAGKQKAKGFRLSSLTKLSQLRGRDRKFTLLHALVEQIMLHEPGLAAFTQELAEFETVPGASIKGLTAEVDVLKNELQKVIKYKKTYKKKIMGDQHPSFFKDLKMAIDKYDTDLSLLTKKCEEMKKVYSDILAKFGETSDQDSQELFGMVCQFIHEFRRVRGTFM